MEPDPKAIEEAHKYVDAIHMASEIGRLDQLSIGIAVLAVLLAFTTLIGFWIYKTVVESEAKRETRAFLKENAREILKEDLRNSVSEVLANDTSILFSALKEAEYLKSVTRTEEISDEQANRITENLENGDDNG